MNLYGLIGYPLGHSFSKQYFNNKFETEGLEDCFFELFPLERFELFSELLQQHSNLKGLAVTIPYKEKIIPYLTFISEEAKAVGAVNCIEFSPLGIKGHNTDVIGFEKSFVPLLQPWHKAALILGTGGASKAAQYVLRKLNIPYLLLSRSYATGNIAYQQLDETIVTSHNIIINCSPVGMSPVEDAAPEIPYQFIGQQHYLFDMIYKPAETIFLKEGKSRGAVTKNGYEMLLLQAEENWKIWNGSLSSL